MTNGVKSRTKVINNENFDCFLLPERSIGVNEKVFFILMPEGFNVG